MASSGAFAGRMSCPKCLSGLIALRKRREGGGEGGERRRTVFRARCIAECLHSHTLELPILVDCVRGLVGSKEDKEEEKEEENEGKEGTAHPFIPHLLHGPAVFGPARCFAVVRVLRARERSQVLTSARRILSNLSI